MSCGTSPRMICKACMPFNKSTPIVTTQNTSRPYRGHSPNWPKFCNCGACHTVYTMHRAGQLPTHCPLQLQIDDISVAPSPLYPQLERSPTLCLLKSPPPLHTLDAHHPAMCSAKVLPNKPSTSTPWMPTASQCAPPHPSGPGQRVLACASQAPAPPPGHPKTSSHRSHGNNLALWYSPMRPKPCLKQAPLHAILQRSNIWGIAPITFKHSVKFQKCLSKANHVISSLYNRGTANQTKAHSYYPN